MKDDKIEGNLPCCSLTDEVIDKIVALVRKGAFRLVAARSLGISDNTFNSWISTGKQHRDEYEAGERSEGTQQMRLVVALEMKSGEHFIEELNKIQDSEGDVRDRDLRFKVHSKRYAREWNSPAIAVDDTTGQEVKADLGALLADRIAAVLGVTGES